MLHVRDGHKVEVDERRAKGHTPATATHVLRSLVQKEDCACSREDNLLPRFSLKVGGFVYGHDSNPSFGLVCGLLKEGMGLAERWI